MQFPRSVYARVILVLLVLYLLNEVIGLASAFLGLREWVNVFYYLGFSPSNINLRLYPWGILTYPWVHISSYALLLNCLLLFGLGDLYERYGYGARAYLSTFFWGSFFGAVCYAIVAYVYEVLSHYSMSTPLYGASAGICALAFALGIRRPRIRVSIAGLRVNYLLLIVLVYAWSILFVGENIGGMLAHLGGALYGCLIGLRQKREQDEDKQNNNHDMNDSQRRAVLDKLRNSGYKSLTKDEQELL